MRVRRERGVTERRRSETERDQIWISGLGWHIIRKTTGGRNGGFVGRSHRGGTLRVLRPAKYDKSSSLTRVEPPRWFTARRKLVKFKSAFKTGLARCPAPPCSRYCWREIPPGLRQEFIAPTFLGSFGWISLLNPFLPAAPQIVASFELPVSFVRPSARPFP